MQWRVKLHRKIEQRERYQDANTARLFFHLLLKVNHKDWRWQWIECPAWSTITSLHHLSVQLWLTTMQIRTSLKKLKNSKNITIKVTSKHSLITVCNWDLYQGDDEYITSNVTTKQQDDNTMITTNNNNNNNNNNQKWKNDNFEKLWTIYPHARKWKKKEAQKKYEESTIPHDVWVREITLYKWGVASGVQDWKYVPAAERYFRDFTPMNEIVYKQTLFRFFDWMKDQRGTDIGEEVRKDFGREYLEEMHKIYLSERKSPLMQSILSLTQ